MPFNRPSLNELIERAQSDIESRMPGANARLRRSVLGVLARVHAGVVHGLHGFLDWLSRQIMTSTAELEWLERQSSEYDIPRVPAAPAVGDVNWTGTNGSVIPAGTIVQRNDGMQYSTDAEETIAAGVATTAVTAVTPGADSNADSGVALSLISPISGVQSRATVAAGGLTAGADAESDDSLRARVLDRKRQPPHGGADFDYVKWAKEVPGVTRAWCYPMEMGDGTVTTRFMTDDTTVDGIPSAESVQAVQDYIDTQRPVTAKGSYVVAPIAVELDITISSLSPSDSTVQAAVEAELADMIRRDAIPGGTILISHIREAISIASGEYDHVLVSPDANVTHDTGEIAVMGAVTWQ